MTVRSQRGREYRFECQQGCTRCCEQTGFVYLSESDVGRIAAFLDLPLAEFERRYVYRSGKQIRLRTPRNGPCHFLTGSGCRIHEVKPTQCRAFPFWPELVASPAAWRHTASWCPGIGKGELIQIETLNALGEEMRAAYPDEYGGA